MKRICFVCLGNICRSPMAEYIFRDMLKKRGLSQQYTAESRGTSDEEYGNHVYRPAAAKLKALGIDASDKTAFPLAASDYAKYDYLIGMDSGNMRSMRRILGSDPEKKVFKLLDFAGGGDIADPWFTGDFDTACFDIQRGLEGFIEYLTEKR